MYMHIQQFKQRYPEYAHLEGDALWDMMAYKMVGKNSYYEDQPGDDEILKFEGEDGHIVWITKGTFNRFKKLTERAEGDAVKETYKFMVIDLSPNK
jgi:hypothetical protein